MQCKRLSAAILPVLLSRAQASATPSQLCMASGACSARQAAPLALQQQRVRGLQCIGWVSRAVCQDVGEQSSLSEGCCEWMCGWFCGGQSIFSSGTACTTAAAGERGALHWVGGQAVCQDVGEQSSLSGGLLRMDVWLGLWWALHALQPQRQQRQRVRRW